MTILNADLTPNTSPTCVLAFAPGDKVRVKPYDCARFTDEPLLSWASGLTGYVVQLLCDAQGLPTGKARVRLYSVPIGSAGEFDQVTEYVELIEHLELLEKGSGQLIVGQTCPYALCELRQMYVEQLLAKLPAASGVSGSAVRALNCVEPSAFAPMSAPYRDLNRAVLQHRELSAWDVADDFSHA